MGKSNFREVIAFLQAPHQIGVPATQSTDANLGFAFYAYQSASIVLPPGEAHRRILMRVEGTASRGGSGAGFQKANVGYCVRCSHIAHIAVPPTYSAGSYDEEICMSTTLWQTMGPWASPYLAAHQNWNTYGALSTHWDWVAGSLDLTAPPPLLFSLVHELPPETDPEATNPHYIPPAVLERPPRRPREILPTAPAASDTPPIVIPLPRDLSEFMVDDNSPPPKSSVSRLETRCPDRRNLSALKQSNFERGGHRLYPANQSQKGSLHDKSRQDLWTLFGAGKPDLTHPFLKGGWEGKSKQDTYATHGAGRQDLEMQGKAKQDSHLSSGRSRTGPEQNPPLRGKSKQDLYVSYGKGK